MLARWTFICLAIVCQNLTAQIPDNLKRENLVAWCIVPFDAKQRSPFERAEMLNALGLTRCAYDWRNKHVPTFEQELLEYEKHRIEYFAFWGQHDAAYEMFRKRNLKPQIWQTLGQFSGTTQEEKVANAVASLQPLVKRTARLGCQLGLYNHGGWGGEPKNLVAVCNAFRDQGQEHVGIVYNFHHGHGHIKDFAQSLEMMKPYLLCLNLNGMVDLSDSKYRGQENRYKIQPIGRGDFEREMIQEIINRKYDGPIGILGHVAERDVADVLRENIEGLEWILKGGKKPDWLIMPDDPPAAEHPLFQVAEDNQGLDARLGFVNVDADRRLNKSGFSIRCRARLFNADNFNILVAKNPKSSATHWELYSFAQTGGLSFYVPGYQPAEIKSNFNVVDGKWHDLEVDFDAGQVVMRVDGKEVHQERLKPGNMKTVIDGPLTIGSLASQQVGCNGQIDEVLIQETRHPDSVVIGHWTFDQASSPNQIRDHSANNARTDFVQTSLGDSYLSKWTPRSRSDTRFAYENERDPEWDDDRFSKMDTGPFFNQSIKLPGRGIIAKAVAVRAPTKQNAHFVFNTETLNLDAAWTGDFVALPPARFAILQTPSVAGSVKFLGPKQVAWKLRESNDQEFRPASAEDLSFLSTALTRDRVVLNYQVGATKIVDATTICRQPRYCLLQRQLRFMQSNMKLGLKLFDIPKNAERSKYTSPDNQREVFVWENDRTAFLLQTTATHEANEHGVWLHPSNSGKQNPVVVWYGQVPVNEVANAVKFMETTQMSSIAVNDYPTRRWGKPIETRGVRAADDQPFVVDTIQIPYENRFRALMFTSGFDFLPDGRAFVCTVHGDVWLVSGIDDDLEKITWQRFATGLYHPLGLKVVDGVPVVLCRDRLLKLVDLNRDGEADVYENFNDDLVITGQNHGYAMSLETDPEGNYYFIKSGDSPPHGGTMLKVLRDGSQLEVFATGYRHANGLGVSPTGLITSADNEGNWIPSTRIDVVHQGGFYGHMPTHRRATAPEIYDPPLMWLPRSMDNSAGGQVWVQSDQWGPLNGSMLHLSFGRCTANVVLPQQLNAQTYQAAAYKMDLPLFLSGSMRGRFNPTDHQLYVCGLDGWQTAAVRDGCFQRVRATAMAFCLPVDFEVADNQIRILFSSELDEAAVEDIANWQIEQWNYRWSGDYGSDHFSIQDPNRVGHDQVAPSRVTLLDDRKTIVLDFETLQPVMQMNIRASLKAIGGKEIEVDLYNTINQTE